jgi:hypothetical protein
VVVVEVGVVRFVVLVVAVVIFVVVLSVVVDGFKVDLFVGLSLNDEKFRF